MGRHKVGPVGAFVAALSCTLFASCGLAAGNEGQLVELEERTIQFDEAKPRSEFESSSAFYEALQA